MLQWEYEEASEHGVDQDCGLGVCAHVPLGGWQPWGSYGA